MFRKKEFAIVSKLRFISGTNFMLSFVEHEKKFYNFGARTFLEVMYLVLLVCGRSHYCYTVFFLR